MLKENGYILNNIIIVTVIIISTIISIIMILRLVRSWALPIGSIPDPSGQTWTHTYVFELGLVWFQVILDPCATPFQF